MCSDRVPRPTADIARISGAYGHRMVEQAITLNAIEEVRAIRRFGGYPAKVFVSYRWESNEHRAWVLALADMLFARAAAGRRLGSCRRH